MNVAKSVNSFTKNVVDRYAHLGSFLTSNCSLIDRAAGNAAGKLGHFRRNCRRDMHANLVVYGEIDKRDNRDPERSVSAELINGSGTALRIHY